MSKTQIKTMTIVDVNPRVRMKDVRSMVANAHNQGKRIDLMGFTGDDIARSQIALQDLLSKEQEKHAKARGHIVNKKNIIESLGEMMSFISECSITLLLCNQKKLDQMTQEMNALREINDHQNTMITQYQDDITRLTGEVEDTMNTLRVALNGSING